MSSTLKSRFSTRVLVLVGSLAFAVVLATVNTVVVLRAHRQLERMAVSPPQRVAEALDRCDANPDSWRSTRLGRLRFDTFDGTSLAPRDRLGGALDRALEARMGTAPSSPVHNGLLWGLGSCVQWRRNQGQGLCGLVQIEVVPSRNWSMWVALALAGAGSMGGLGLLLAWGTVVRPLRGRIRQLRQIAEQLGREEGTPVDRDPDDLDAVARSLERGIEQQARARALLARRAESLERHLAEMAHDLRTPLAALQLALERLLADVPPAERKALLARALSEHVYMTTLLANLEVASTIEGELTSQLAESDVELGMLLETVVARFALLAEQRGIQISLGRPDTAIVLRAAPTLLERGIGNLVHNAIRHGRPGGHVAVLLVQTPGAFVLSVEDDGPGMPESLLAAIAHPPSSLPRGTSRADGSLGLGLGIVITTFRRAGLTLAFERGDEGGLRVTATSHPG